MWILAYFTRDGEPATGLSPLVKVRDVETGVIVISGSSMLERGDGFYGYDFAAYNPLRDYAVICDSVTLSGVERYTYASSGEYSEVLDSIESTVGIVDIRTTLLRKIQTNRLELFDGDTDNWILYDDDETTPLLTFSVSDKNNDIIVQCPSTPSKRSGAAGVSGVLSPDIYMKKSIYDPDGDGCVNCAENVSDGVYTSTASGVWNAVDLAHHPCILGTKCIDETNIAHGLFVSYNAITDRLEYVYAASSGISGTMDHGALLGLTDPDHPAYAIYTNTATFSGILSSADTTVQKALETLDQHGPHGAGGGECCGLAGKEVIANGTDYTDVTFPTALGDENYVVTVNIVNDVDVEPSNYAYTTTNIETTGFRVRYSGDIDSDNYVLHWTTSSGMCGDYYTKPEIDILLGVNKSGKELLIQGMAETSVNFASAFSNDDYRLFISLENEIDLPSSEYAVTITETTISGFKVHYSDDIDSNNYYLNWYATTSGAYGGDCISEVKDDLSPELGGDLVLGSHSIVVNTTPSGWSGDISTMTVDWNDNGIGTPLHMKSNGHWEQCTATSGSTRMPCGAMAIETGTGVKKILWKGIVKNSLWSWTPGQVIYASTVDGALTSSKPTASGSWAQSLGLAIASDIIRFDLGFNPGTIN